MRLIKSKIKKILVITLSNIGDVVLTFPVIDILKEQFPEADLNVIVGPKGEPLLRGNKNIAKVIPYDKHQPVPAMISFVFKLRREKYDLVVDLRNTAIPFMIGPKYRTSPFVEKPVNPHMKQKHLIRLKSVVDFDSEANKRISLDIPEQDKDHVDSLFADRLKPNDEFVVISPGAADEKKRWTEDGFAELCDRLIAEHKVKVVFVGDLNDGKVVNRIVEKMHQDTINLCGQTSLTQLAYLVNKSALAIVNDSACMHIASYLNVPVLALFGPTDSRKYGPWSQTSCLVEGNKDRVQADGESDYMKRISSDEVFKVITKTDQGFGFI